MKNTDTKNKIKNLNAQEINRKTLMQSLVRRVGIVNKNRVPFLNKGIYGFFIL